MTDQYRTALASMKAVLSALEEDGIDDLPTVERVAAVELIMLCQCVADEYSELI